MKRLATAGNSSKLIRHLFPLLLDFSSLSPSLFLADRHCKQGLSLPSGEYREHGKQAAMRAG